LQDMVKEFQGHFSEPTVANLQKGLWADFEIWKALDATIPLHSPYRISPTEEEEHLRQLDMAIRCCWIQPSWSNFG
jgi:hypothetical protein